MATSSLTQQFKVWVYVGRKRGLSDEDLDKLHESLSIDREEPAQLKPDLPSLPEPELEESVEMKIERYKTQFEDWIKAAEQMKLVLAEKMKDRVVKIDPRKDIAVRDAIRRLFNKDTNVITHEMFRYCLDAKSRLLQGEEGIIDIPGVASIPKL